MNILVEKLREVLYAVLPVTVIVLLLHFTIAPLENYLLMRFAIGAVLIVIGLAIFLFGVDIGITPIGVLMRGPITERNKAWIIAVAGLMLGFFISIAEPDLQILADQVDFVTSGAISKLSLVVVVSSGLQRCLRWGCCASSTMCRCAASYRGISDYLGAGDIHFARFPTDVVRRRRRC